MADRSSTGRPGSLRVYLGAAPGVGKTYAMLREGHRLRDEGRDVVVGLVETHGRHETAAQIAGLELVPCRMVRHGPVEIDELDVAAIIERHPDVVLVDELAHTNAPGSPNAKRYQDVLDLLAAGIDVITTMNVQHLESLHGQVSSITGVEVREVVPDSVLDLAEDIQLVDLPVGALLDRLQAGKIYPGRSVDQALTGFFREGNLTALRELALRRTAEDVDDELNDLMFVHGDSLIATSDRVLVLLDFDVRWGRVIRAAWRLASALRGEVLVVALVPGGTLDGLGGDRRAALDRLLQLAEDLGAETVVLDGDPGELAATTDSLVELVRRERVSMLVTGVPEPPRGFLRRRSSPVFSLAEGVLQRLDSLEVHLVAVRGESSGSSPNRH